MKNIDSKFKRKTNERPLSEFVVYDRMPKSLRRFWKRQDLAMISWGILWGGFLMGTMWLMSL